MRTLKVMAERRLGEPDPFSTDIARRPTPRTTFRGVRSSRDGLTLDGAFFRSFS